MEKRDLNKDLQFIKDYLRPLEKIECTAKTLSEAIPAAIVYLGICGINLSDDFFAFYDGFFYLRKVTNHPSMVHICQAANAEESQDFLSVTKYSSSLSAELAIGSNYSGETLNKRMIIDFGWHFVALLKIRGATNLYCPCASSCSWDTVAVAKPHSVEFRLLDDTSRLLCFNNARTVSQEDIAWIDTNYKSALELRDSKSSRRFGLAYNIAYTWNQTDNRRIALTNLWCGLDALFGCKTDRPVTGKLLNRICDWLPHIDKEEIRTIYNIRSDAIHGRYFDNEFIDSAIVQTDNILRAAIIQCIEKNQKSLPDWEDN